MEATYRLLKVILVTVAIIAVTLVTVTYLTEQNRKDNEYFCNGAPITVNEGDTLYWIAKTNCEGNFMRVVDKLVTTYGSDIQVGDTIYLPTHPNCELRLTDGGQVMEECK